MKSKNEEKHGEITHKLYVENEENMERLVFHRHTDGTVVIGMEDHDAYSGYKLTPEQKTGVWMWMMNVDRRIVSQVSRINKDGKWVYE